MGTFNISTQHIILACEKSYPTKHGCTVRCSVLWLLHSLIPPLDGDVPHDGIIGLVSCIYSFVMWVVCPEGYEGKICF